MNSGSGRTLSAVTVTLGRNEIALARLQRNVSAMQLEPTLLSCAEIVSRLREELPDLRARYGVEALSIFGSRVQGGARPESDVDVLVEFSRAPGFFRFIELEDELSAKLGVKVDLVMKTALRPRIGRRALAEAVPI